MRHPYLVSPRLVGDKGDPLPVGRPGRRFFARKRLRYALNVAPVRSDGKDLTVGGDRRALGRGREIIAIGLIADRDGLDVVLFVVRDDVDLDWRRLAGLGVQLPDAEVLLIDDGLAVTG